MRTIARRVLIIVPGVGRQLPAPVCRLVAHGCERRRDGQRLGGVSMPSGGHGLGVLVAPELPVALHEKHRRLQGTPADQGRESVSAGRLNHHNRSPHSPQQRIALAGRHCGARRAHSSTGYSHRTRWDCLRAQNARNHGALSQFAACKCRLILAQPGLLQLQSLAALSPPRRRAQCARAFP